jgi:hypothetical protein
MHRLKLLSSVAMLLSPGLILVGPPQNLLEIDASKQPAPPARGRGSFPGSNNPGHSASLPIRLELQMSNGQLRPDGTVLADFVITNIGTETITVPSSLDGNGPSSDILTLWLTSDAVNDAYAKDTSTGRAFKIEIVPTSAELYGRRNDPHSFLLVAPNQSVKVHTSSRVQLQPGKHTATAHAELLHIVRDSSGSSELAGTADSEAVTITLSPANSK